MQTDTPWKEVLDEFFPDFTALFFPVAFADIDWNKGFKVLDKEFQKLMRGKGQGHLTVDKLLEVHRKDGKSILVLVHIEIQAQKQKEFPARMFIYHSRIFEKYKRPVMSIAVLTDQDPSWRPSSYEHGFGGCRVKLVFPTIKLIDYRDRQNELSDSENLFSIAVLAHLKAMETEKDEDERYKWKLAFMRRLNLKAPVRNVNQLVHFVDWMFDLSDQHDVRFWVELKEKEGDNLMPYVTSLERISRKEGRQEGLEQGRLNMARESVLEALVVRFGDVPQSLKKAVKQTPTLEKCKSLLQIAIRAESMDAFKKQLQELQ